MSFYNKAAYCPVGEERLGLIVKGEVNSYLCEDCGFIYTWNIDGVLLAPVKVLPPKDNKCDCGSCQMRNLKRG